MCKRLYGLAASRKMSMNSLFSAHSSYIYFCCSHTEHSHVVYSASTFLGDDLNFSLCENFNEQIVGKRYKYLSSLTEFDHHK